MKIDSKMLRSALSDLAPICGKRSPIPLAAFVRLRALGQELQLLSANGEAQAESSIPCEGELHGFACVNHRTFAAMLPSSGIVELTQSDAAIHIRSGDSVKQLPSTDWSGMPIFQIEGSGDRILVDCGEVSESIKFCQFASGTNAGFPHAGILHFKSSRIEAADGRIIAFAPLTSCESKVDMTLPYDLAAILCPVLSAENAHLVQNGNLLAAYSTGRSVFVKLSEGGYPNTDSILERPEKKCGAVSSAELLTCFESVMAVYEDGVACSVDIGRDELVIKYSTKFGSVEAPLVGAFKPQETFYINPSLAIQPLKSFDGDVELALVAGGDKANGLRITDNKRSALVMLCRGN